MNKENKVNMKRKLKLKGRQWRKSEKERDWRVTKWKSVVWRGKRDLKEQQRKVSILMPSLLLYEMKCEWEWCHFPSPTTDNSIPCLLINPTTPFPSPQYFMCLLCCVLLPFPPTAKQGICCDFLFPLFGEEGKKWSLLLSVSEVKF